VPLKSKKKPRNSNEKLAKCVFHSFSPTFECQALREMRASWEPISIKIEAKQISFSKDGRVLWVVTLNQASIQPFVNPISLKMLIQIEGKSKPLALKFHD